MRRGSTLLALILLVAGLRAEEPQQPVLADTFSIVAYDAEGQQWGVATASRALAVGNCVPWGKAGVGGIATQSSVNVAFGSKGLELLAEGKSAEDVVKILIEADKGRELRQLGIVDAKGNVAHFSGKLCGTWAGAKTGKHFVCLGNILTGEEVVTAMAKAYEDSTGPFPWRLMAALEAGEKAGGDKRGKQAAAILVVRGNAGPNGFGDRYVDLRVDDHETPIQELARAGQTDPQVKSRPFSRDPAGERGRHGSGCDANSEKPALPSGSRLNTESIMYRRCLGLLVWSALAGVLSAQELPLLFSEDFEKGAERWQPTDPAAWKVIDSKEGARSSASSSRASTSRRIAARSTSPWSRT